MATRADIEKYELQLAAYKARIDLYARSMEATMAQMQSNTPYAGMWEQKVLARDKQRFLQASPPRTAPAQRYYGIPDAFDFDKHAAMCRAEVNRLLGRPHDDIPYHPAFPEGK